MILTIIAEDTHHVPDILYKVDRISYDMWFLIIYLITPKSHICLYPGTLKYLWVFRMDEKTKKEMFQELIHDDDVEFAKLVPKVKQIVKIKSDGTPVIVCDLNKLTQQEQIIAYLTGKFFAKLVGATGVESAQVKDIAQALRLNNNVVAARLVTLKDSMQVEQVSRGEYRVSTVALEKILDQILKKIGI